MWATAPYMHDNAIGPEVCGKPKNKTNDFYQSPYVDSTGKKLTILPPCVQFDPSIEGRYRLFEASVAELLTPPDKRPQKLIYLDENITFQMGPKIWDPVHKVFIQFRMDIPKDTPQAQVGNLLYKNLIDDMVLSVTDFNALQDRMKDDAKEVRSMLDELIASIGPDPIEPFKIFNNHQTLLRKHYMTNTEFFQNRGHAFGTDLSEADKKALTAFLATL